ncbi:MAG TPA: hypothetical protein VJ346_10160 [Bacteroidales bacterium]|nr:hypothetical protein [Bacteroidales bacterium]
MNNLFGTLFTMAASVLALLLGIVYLTRPKFMKYHGTTVRKEWNELAPEMQTLILALMRGVSAGYLSVAIAIIILQLELAGYICPA